MKKTKKELRHRIEHLEHNLALLQARFSEMEKALFQEGDDFVTEILNQIGPSGSN